ncbi:MAG: rhodanese-like domain-containing protein [Sphingobacteriales bacterium]|nr:rhodanese-like domain-containing protein [Sphingobacteriales bacterium]
MGFFSFLGTGTVKKALKQGAVIIDVRTANEYDRGRIPGSLNIPVDRIAISAERIRHLNKPVVLCCASGHRSRIAMNTLKQKGLKEVYNGGNWEKVLRILESL